MWRRSSTGRLSPKKTRSWTSRAGAAGRALAARETDATSTSRRRKNMAGTPGKLASRERQRPEIASGGSFLQSLTLPARRVRLFILLLEHFLQLLDRVFQSADILFQPFEPLFARIDDDRRGRARLL